MIYFIVPALNEAANMPRLLQSLRQWSEAHGERFHLILVDDGSQDDTAGIVRRFPDLPSTIVSHGRNRGVHEAFRSGFRAWSQVPARAEDLVVTLEADNTSSVAILDQMVASARQGADLVLASCYAPGGEVVGTNLMRTTLSACANLILRWTPGMPRVYTFSSFYRVYRARFLSAALRSYGDRLIEEEGFVCVVEMLLKFGLLNGRIREVPLRLDGSQRRGTSKMRVLRTIRGYLVFFLSVVVGRTAKPDASICMEDSIVQTEPSSGT